MSRPRKTRPDGFVLYAHSLRVLQVLPDEAAGKAIKAACAYFLSGQEMPEDSSMEYLAYSVLRLDVDAALDRFRETCDRNRENRHHSSPVVTSGDSGLLSGRREEKKRKESEKSRKEFEAGPPSAAPARKSFSELISERTGTQ